MQCGQVRSETTHHEMAKCIERVFKKSLLSPGWCGSVIEWWMQTERSPFWFLVRARAQAAGQVPSWGVCERQLIDVSLTHCCFSSLSLSLPFPLKVNNFFFFKSLKLNTTSHNTSWYTDLATEACTTLQKIIPGFFGSPLVYVWLWNQLEIWAMFICKS